MFHFQGQFNVLHVKSSFTLKTVTNANLCQLLLHKLVYQRANSDEESCNSELATSAFHDVKQYYQATSSQTLLIPFRSLEIADPELRGVTSNNILTNSFNVCETISANLCCAVVMQQHKSVSRFNQLMCDKCFEDIKHFLNLTHFCTYVQEVTNSYFSTSIRVLIKLKS